MTKSSRHLSVREISEWSSEAWNLSDKPDVFGSLMEQQGADMGFVVR